MSKKAAKKTTKKPTKKTASKSVATRAPAKKESALTKHHLHNETEEFYAAHPNVKPLLILFLLVATAVFIYLIKVRTAVAM